MSDAELVRAVMHGDGEAFSEIVSRYKNYVFSVIRQSVRSNADAEDIAQETFIDAWRGMPALREPDKLRSWLYGIARRKSLRYLSKLREHEDVDGFEISDASLVEDHLLRKEKRGLIRDAVMKLSEKNRAVCVMFYIRGMSVERIAVRLGLPIGTVKSRLFEARNKLREELKEMEEKNTISERFDKDLKEKIKEIMHYYRKHGESWEGFDEAFSETEKALSALPDSKDKDFALADIYAQGSYRKDSDPELREKAFEKARSGGNGRRLAYLYVDEAFAQGDNHSGWLDVIDSKAIPELNKMGCISGEGVMRFWRGSALLSLKRYAEAYAELKKAVDMIDRDDVYHACALTAVRSIDLAREYADDPNALVNAMSETYLRDGSRVMMTSEPGFGGNAMYERHPLDALGYYCSRYDSSFFDTSLGVGEVRKTKDGNGEFTVISYDEPVSVPAGTFPHSMRVRYEEKNNYAVNVWYAENVGLVKADFTGDWSYKGGETYELSEYEIKGGKGYYPFALGNRWRYVNKDLPDYLFYRHEVEVDWISEDGDTVNVSYLTAAFLKKNYETEYQLDSSVYMDKANDLSESWKLHEAADELKKAVRANSTQDDAALALSWIPVMERFADYHDKGWRFCPGSMGNWTFRKDDAAVKLAWGDWSIGPYRLGTRGHKEDRIFGVKPLRYLEQLAGSAWNDEWKPGYTGTRRFMDIDVTLAITDGGAVTVPAGTFDNCLKLTITAEKPDADDPEYYFRDNYNLMFCGTKEFWYAPGVGIVRHDCHWGDILDSSCVLVRYDLPAADDSMFPVQIGNRWEYDETHLTEENYRAKFIMSVICGIGGRFTVSTSQEFVWQGTEEEYEAWKKEHDNI